MFGIVFQTHLKAPVARTALLASSQGMMGGSKLLALYVECIGPLPPGCSPSSMRFSPPRHLGANRDDVGKRRACMPYHNRPIKVFRVSFITPVVPVHWLWCIIFFFRLMWDWINSKKLEIKDSGFLNFSILLS